MPQFIPLPLAGYDWNRRDIRPELVAAPPYDVLSPEQRKALAAKSPYNLVHMDLPDSYAKATLILNHWLGRGIIRRADQPAFRLMASRYTLRDREYVRWGFLGGLRLSPWGEDGVFPHEQTYPKVKTDRLELMRATNAQLSPIFGVFNYPGKELEAECNAMYGLPPDLVLHSDDGVEHRFWTVPQEQESLVSGILQDVYVYIADGHHRYETALTYARERNEIASRHLDWGRDGKEGQDRPWWHVFACLCNIASPGVEILPYHRLVTSTQRHSWEDILARAEQWFTLEKVTSARALEDNPLPSACLLMLSHGMWVMTLKAEELAQCDPLFKDIGAYVLDTFFLRKAMGLTGEELAKGGHLTYTPFADQAGDAVAEGRAQAALLLQPVSMDTLRTVSESGRVMPRKSTFFHPKIPGGLFFHLLD